MIYKQKPDMSIVDITFKYRLKMIIMYCLIIILSIHSASAFFTDAPLISYKEKIRVDTFERLVIFKHGLTKITVDRNANVPSFCNNPGAIRPSSDSRINDLAIGTIETPSGPFLYFPNKELGFKALRILLTKHYGDKTIKQCIYSFAPPHENNTEKYISELTKSLKCHSTTLVKNCNIHKLMLSIAKVEGFK